MDDPLNRRMIVALLALLPIVLFALACQSLSPPPGQAQAAQAAELAALPGTAVDAPIVGLEPAPGTLSADAMDAARAANARDRSHHARAAAVSRLKANRNEDRSHRSAKPHDFSKARVNKRRTDRAIVGEQDVVEHIFQQDDVRGAGAFLQPLLQRRYRIQRSDRAKKGVFNCEASFLGERREMPGPTLHHSGVRTAENEDFALVVLRDCRDMRVVMIVIVTMIVAAAVVMVVLGVVVTVMVAVGV